MNLDSSILDKLVYPKGWLLCSSSYSTKDFNLPDRFVKLTINPFYDLFYDPENVINLINKEDCGLLLMGYAFDISNLSLSFSEIAYNLLNSYISNGLNSDFFESANNLAGHWLIMVFDKENCIVFNDALGLKQIYFHTRLKILASHYKIIVNYSKDNPIDLSYWDICKQFIESKLLAPYILPVNQTPYKNIFFLIPNTYISMKSNLINRFFPSREATDNDVYSISEFISKNLRNIINKLHDDYDLVASLTAGFDIRTTLAACKDIKADMRFFTYYFSRQDVNKETYRSSLNDVEIGTILANLFNLDYTTIQISSTLYPETIELAKKNHYSVQHPELYPALVSSGIINNNTIFLRSNIYELFRGPYYSTHKYINDREYSAVLAKLYCRRENFPYYNDICKLSEEYFYQNKVKQCIELGYDYSQIFYAEHWTSQWLGVVINESDPYFTTICPPNCRNLILPAFSFSKELKDRKKLPSLIIRNLWPELLDNVNYPNIMRPLGKLIDFNAYKYAGVYHFTDVRKNIPNFKIRAFNGNNELKDNYYYCEYTLESTTCGFAVNKLKKDDTLEISFNIPFTKYYVLRYVTFTISTLNHTFGKFHPINYTIEIDCDKLYEIATQDFIYPNNFEYVFKAKNDSYFQLKISIVVQEDINEPLYNSLIKISNISTQPANKFNGPVPFFKCTQQEFGK